MTAWLKKHPNIELVSRDGSKTYAKAITKASSQIKQVGDRWHILHQLFEAVKKEVYSILPAKWTTCMVISHKKEEPTTKRKIDSIREQNEEKRWIRIQSVQAMVEEGKSIASIARELGISRGTVYKDLKISSQPSHRRYSPYDQYRLLINKLVARKLPSKQIEKSCRARGYNGSTSTLNKMIAEERKQSSTEILTLSLRQKILKIIWNFEHPNHTDQIRNLHPQIVDLFPELLAVDKLVLTFRSLYHHKARDGLRNWLLTYKECKFHHIRSFINGIRQDIKAVWYSIVQPWSNGPVEGQVNRLKTIKRMMYGRANFELLRNRFLYQW